MSEYPESEPFDSGLLEVGDGDLVYWELCGNPDGKPAVVFHGGPGSGCSTWFRTLFDPAAYLTVLFDQRNCGRSRPHASDPKTDLRANTTQNLIADAELLREQLRIERWLVLGGSWGSTLALAYAETHPVRVTEIVLSGITTGRHAEFDWLFRGGLARFFPGQWARLVDELPRDDRDDVVSGYHALLSDPEPAVRRRAAEAWCMWESATPAWPPADGLAERFTDPDYALAFARIVTHYVKHNAWLDDGILLRNASVLWDIPGTLVHGRFDFQAPLENAYALSRAWPRAELVVVDEAGHVPTGAVAREITRATDGFR
ncbi:MAG TPA: prolyl aminopeptidase [Gaiellaceae bacterium]|nr:prolyl aminopeptidase [Gaiellaceae bacterium]